MLKRRLKRRTTDTLLHEIIYISAHLSMALHNLSLALCFFYGTG